MIFEEVSKMVFEKNKVHLAQFDLNIHPRGHNLYVFIYCLIVIT